MVRKQILSRPPAGSHASVFAEMMQSEDVAISGVPWEI